MKFFISAAVHTSTSGFQYIIQQIVVLLFLSSCICLSSFQYLMEAVSVLLFPDSSTCTSRFLYNLCFFLVLVSGTFLNSVVTSMYVFYTNLSGVFRYCHCQLPLPTATANCYCHCQLLLPTATANCHCYEQHPTQPHPRPCFF